METQTEADLETAGTAGKYTVYVTATDPSFERAFVKVDITATQANDAPKIWAAGTDNNPAPGELSVAEQNSDDIDGTVGIDNPYDPARPDEQWVQVDG